MKKKGSALVFSVLMLAFFLALSLNIYFLARKKAERSGVKVAGEKTTNNIDMASSIGYQELKLAEEMVRVGFLYDDTHPNVNNSYSVTTDGSYLYLNPSTGDFNSGERYAGIQINNFIDYFSSSWNPGSSTSKNQKLIIGEEISGGKIVSRTWLSTGVDVTVTPLWIPTSGSVSIGGYTLESTSPSPISDGTEREAVYKKDIILTNPNIDDSFFTVTVTEIFDLSGGVISNRSIKEFTIESLN